MHWALMKIKNNGLPQNLSRFSIKFSWNQITSDVLKLRCGQLQPSLSELQKLEGPFVQPHDSLKSIQTEIRPHLGHKEKRGPTKVTQRLKILG